MNSNNPSYKNIVYGNISAGGDVHIGDVIYNVEQDFSHAILFFRLEKSEGTNTYTANLSLKAKHKTVKKFFQEEIKIDIPDSLFLQVNDFQEVRRSVDAIFRRGGSANPQEVTLQEQNLADFLFNTFFKEDILKVCKVFVELLEKRKIKELLLAISCDDNQVVNLPFELLIPTFFPVILGQKRQSLAVNTFGFVRTLEPDLSKFDMQGKMASAAPLKMLFVTALPENLDERAKMLEIEEEQKRLIDAIGSFEATGGKPKIVIEFLDTASLSEITNALQEHQHDILHISGHGSYDKQVKQGVLHLEDEDGNHREVTGKDLGEHLRAHDCLKLLILSACETAIAGSGVVEQLATFGVPAVVAMRFSVTDDAAKLFTTALYKNLSQGHTLTHALAQAREELWQSVEQRRTQSPNNQHLAEWFTPVVYLNQYCENLIDSQAKYVFPNAFYPKSDFLKTKNTRLIGSGFIGRKRYLNLMRRSFAAGDHVCLHGLGGLGKTTLAEAFANNYDNKSHDLIVFRNGTEIGEKQMIDEFFARMKDDEKANKSILRQLEQYINSDAEPELKLQRLFDNYLNNGRKAIIIFDNFEDVLDIENQGDTRKIKRESLAKFLQYFCKNLPKSCHVLITSRYVIEDLKPYIKHFSLEKMTYAEQYRLTNFSETLRKIPLSERQDMIKRFDGHPRAYEFLETLFKDDKTLTWQDLSTSVGQVEARIWENLLLEKIYHRLNAAQQQVFQMAAICITKTPIAALEKIYKDDANSSNKKRNWFSFFRSKKNVVISKVDLLQFLKILQNWSLCHVDENGDFEVHRLTREWALKNVIDKDKTKYWSFAIGKFFSEKNNISIEEREKAKNYFEIAEVWEDFARISFELQDYYQLIGLNQKALELNQIVLEKNLEEKPIAIALSNMGHIYKIFGQNEQALSCYEQSFTIDKKNRDYQGQSANLNSIGLIHYAKGNYDSALRYLEQSLAIQQEIGDRQGEGATLNNISHVYDAKGDYDNASRFLEQSSTIKQQIGDSQCSTLNDLAIIAKNKGDYNTALQYFKQSLTISQQIGDCKVESAILNNISQIYTDKGGYNKALQYLEQSLTISQQIGYRKGEAITLNNISQVHEKKGNYDIALQYLEQSLVIQKQIKDTVSLAVTLANIGAIYFQQKNDIKNALMYFWQSYHIFTQLGSPNVQVPGSYLFAILEQIGEAKYQEIVSQLKEENKI